MLHWFGPTASGHDRILPVHITHILPALAAIISFRSSKRHLDRQTDMPIIILYSFTGGEITNCNYTYQQNVSYHKCINN